MTKEQARRISNQHSFTNLQLRMMLIQAIENYPDSYWKTPSPNKSFTMGWYFNMCWDWVKSEDEKTAAPIFAFRILHKFGEFSEIQPPKREKKRKHKPMFHSDPDLPF